MFAEAARDVPQFSSPEISSQNMEDWSNLVAEVEWIL